MDQWPGVWWPVGISEQFSAAKPTAVQLGDAEFALFRDASGAVRAVEDRCPHRRAPLSLGKVTAAGQIQCGYHGWIFNGQNGAIEGFPNLGPDERVPQCAIATYTVSEQGGFVYLWPDPSPPGPLPAFEPLPAVGDSFEFHGHGLHPLAHRECVSALLDCPGQVIRCLGVEFLDQCHGDPALQDGWLVSDRAARWNLLGESRLFLGPLRHRADFPLRLSLRTAPQSGETIASLFAGEDRLLLRVQLALTPVKRGMTAVGWSGAILPAAWGRLAPVVGLACKLRLSPFRLCSRVNCAILAKTLPGPGGEWKSLLEAGVGKTVE